MPTSPPFESWLRPDASGLYCLPGGFHIDPHAPVDRAIITHGHSDHARPGPWRRAGDRRYPRHHEAAARRRRGGTFQALAYGETLQIGGVTVSLRPAGHILGSAQLVIEHQGQRAVDLGRLQAPARSRPAMPSSSCPAISSSPRRPSAFRSSAMNRRTGEVAKLLASLRDFPERTHLVGVYGLGKCQRLDRAAAAGGI